MIQYLSCLIAAVLVVITPTVAQQQNKGIADKPAQSPAKEYKVSKQNGKLILSDGKHQTVVSSDPNASSPLVNGDDVFYIAKAKEDINASGSSIHVFHISTKSTEDIIAPNATASEYDPKNVVENILLDKAHGKLYFSAWRKNRRGYAQFLTWVYDLKTKTLAAYKDGKIKSLDEQGNQVIVFEGFDSKGKYTSSSLVAPDGNVIKELGKEYASKSIK